MKCPVCSVGLVMSERKGIEIDYCPQCRGVWLDRGELDKIIEKSGHERSEGPKEHRSHGSDDRDEYRRHADYKKHKRKSFFEELFD